MHHFIATLRRSIELRSGFLGELCAALVVAGLCGCGSSGSGGAATGTGGAVAANTGGTPSTAGAGNGGATNTGGANSSGGASSGGVGTGGIPSAAGTGGVATGGAPSTGGAAATGGTDPVSHDDAGSEVTLAELPLMLADASCGALEQCLGAASATFFNGGTCKATLEPATVEGSASLFAASVSKGTLAYDPSKVAACLDSIGGSGCDYPDRRLDALCPGVVVGRVALGSACSLNAECGASAYCKGTTCPGTCTALVAKGAACSADDDCADGLVCDATAKKCLTPGKKGDACSAAAPCGSAFVCDGSSHCVEFGSIFAAKEGTPCNPDGHVLCDPALTCALVDIDAAQKGVWSCQKPVTTGTCHIALPEQCASGNYCELSGTLSGTCKPAPLASASCASRLPSDTTVAKDICAPGLTCGADGSCHARAHLTEACASDSDCVSGTCKGKVCVAAACSP